MLQRVMEGISYYGTTAGEKIAYLQKLIEIKDNECLKLKNELEASRNAVSVDLDESSRRFKELLKNVNAPMLLVNPDNGNIAASNAAASAFLGYTVEELKSMNLRAILQLPDEEINDEINKLRNFYEGRLVYKLCLKDGSLRYVELHNGPFFINGSVLLMCIIKDITEHYNKTNEFIKDLERNTALLDAVPDIVFVLSREGFYTGYKPDIMNRRHFNPSDMIGKHISEAGFSHAAVKTIQNAIEEVLETRQLKHINFEFAGSEGKTIYYDCRITWLNEDEVIGISRDISDDLAKDAELYKSYNKNKILYKEIDLRYTIEKQLKFNESLLKTIINATNQAFYAVDLKTNDILFCNKYFFELWKIHKLYDVYCTGSLKHDSLMSVCMPEVHDLSRFVELLSWNPADRLTGSLCEKLKMTDGRILKLTTTTIHEGRHKKDCRLYIFEEVIS